MNLSTGQGWRYGLLGLPLAFVALPLYVLLPNHYAREFGMPLGTMGAVLLAARLFDAIIDPWIGRWCDHLFARSTQAVLAGAACAAILLGTGFALLFYPPGQTSEWLLAWLGGLLGLTYAGYSMLGVAHQSWGAMLGGDAAQRSRIVAWREGFALLGVLTAAVSPSLLGLPATVGLLWLALLLGWLAWRAAPRPVPVLALRGSNLWQPLQRPAFRRLLAVFMCSGIASALPATLLLFYVQDRLQVARSMEPVFLGTYFTCAALAIPLWLRLVSRLGLERTWLCGMGLAVASFAAAAPLGPGDAWQFALVCASSGVALGTDVALPAALLAGAIAREGDRGRAEGAYFGWWNFATKLNLALAAGLALPALAALGYSPGSRDRDALNALVAGYCLLPCLLKLLAALLLYMLLIRRSTPDGVEIGQRANSSRHGRLLNR